MASAGKPPRMNRMAENGRAAGSVVAQAVDGDHAGMLELAGDLGLQDEPGPPAAVVGVSVLDLLEGDLAVELVVEGHRDRAEADAGMRPDDPGSAVPGGRPAQQRRGTGRERKFARPRDE